ncbi:MAG: Tad domain-containing protein [Planctomycetota bacterium]
MNHTPSNPSNARPWRKRSLRRSPKSRGAVLVLALMGGFLIVGLIGYVFNTGRHAQLRQQTQSAADATVISGAGYVARTFNTVAMNNVEISRLIPAVQLLDAVPQAAQYAFEDTDALLSRVDEQLTAGTGDAVFDDKLREVADELREQHWKLQELNEFFNESGYDVREMTFYDSEFGRGEMWKAMESLDAISSASMEALAELNQVTAIHTGRRNLRGSSGEHLAAMAPFEFPYVWQRYTFDDFKEPVILGNIPGDFDDETSNRGPYDTIFGWRGDISEPDERELVGYRTPTQQTTSTSSGGSSSWSGGGGGGSSNGGPIYNWIPGEVLAYYSFGTWPWMSLDFQRSIPQRLQEFPQESQFEWYVQRIAEHKLVYLWDDAVQVGTVGDPPNLTYLVNQPQPIFDPEWITDYSRARSLISAQDPRVRHTQWIQVYFETPVDEFDRPLGPEEMIRWGIIRSVADENGIGARIEPPDEGGELRKLSSHVWEDKGERTDTTQFLNESGQVTGTTTQIFRQRWMYVWAGLDIGEEVEVRNPNNFESRDDLPAPMDFVHNEMERPNDGDPGYPGSAFTFLGLAKQPNNAPMWGRLFNNSAYDGHTAIAQASVFNNHSWDLWTQMWHAQLEPVQEYDQWVELIQSQLGSASGYDDLSVGELEELTEYLRSLESLAPIMLTH